jgi:hypothetical protein
MPSPPAPETPPGPTTDRTNHGRRNIFATLLAVGILLAAGLAYAAVSGSESPASNTSGGTAQRLGILVGPPGYNNSSTPRTVNYSVISAVSVLTAMDIHFCYLNATNIPISQAYNATLESAGGLILASYSSADATSCVSPSTGLSPSTPSVGGWETGANASVEVRDQFVIQVPDGERVVWFSDWTTEGSWLTTLQT